MRAFLGFLMTSLLAIVGGAVVLLLAWLLALGLTRLLGLELSVAMGCALGALVVLSTYMSAILAQRAPVWPWRELEGPLLVKETDDFQVEPEEEHSGWFTLCPCGSGRLFSRCCGHRAFRKSQASRGR